MNVRTQRLLNLSIGFFFILSGLYLAYSFAISIQEMNWNALHSEAQAATLGHPVNDDLSQTILSALCAIGGIICGASHIWFLILHPDK